MFSIMLKYKKQDSKIEIDLLMLESGVCFKSLSGKDFSEVKR